MIVVCKSDCGYNVNGICDKQFLVLTNGLCEELYHNGMLRQAPKSVLEGGTEPRRSDLKKILEEVEEND